MTTEEAKALASVFLCAAACDYTEVADLEDGDPRLTAAREELHSRAIDFAITIAQGELPT